MARWNFKNNVSARLSALGLAFVLGSGSLIVPATEAWAASSHSRLHGDTYQLADGTAISGVVARGIDISHWQGEIEWKQVARNDIKFVMLEPVTRAKWTHSFIPTPRGLLTLDSNWELIFILMH